MAVTATAPYSVNGSVKLETKLCVDRPSQAPVRGEDVAGWNIVTVSAVVWERIPDNLAMERSTMSVSDKTATETVAFYFDPA